MAQGPHVRTRMLLVRYMHEKGHLPVGWEVSLGKITVKCQTCPFTLTIPVENQSEEIIKSYVNLSCGRKEVLVPLPDPQTIDRQHAELVSRLRKPGTSILAGSSSTSLDALHMAVGICGECIELDQAILKDDESNIAEEIGDLLFFIVGLSQALSLIPVAAGTYYDGVFAGPLMARLIAAGGDVLDLVKRFAIYENAQPMNEKLAILLSYLQILLADVASDYGLTLAQCKESNISKLTKRYGRIYSNEAANARTDKAETTADNSTSRG